MARNAHSVTATDDERRSAFVCRVVELLLDHGYGYEQIAREANASLDLKERRALAKRYRVNAAEPLNVAALRVFLDRHKGGSKPPTGATPEILHRYINREKRRFPSFLSEYFLLMRESFLDPSIISDAELMESTPKAAFENFFVSASYRILGRMLGVDNLSLRKTAKEFDGEYLCVRTSSRGSDNVVLSTIRFQQRKNTEEIWEFRHAIDDEHYQSRESDGMVLALGRHLVMLGDIGHGHGLEMLVMERLGFTKPNILSGVISTLSLSGKPVVGQFALFRKKGDDQPLTGVYPRAVCVDDLAKYSVVSNPAHIAAVLDGIKSTSLGLPVFQSDRDGDSDQDDDQSNSH